MKSALKESKYKVCHVLMQQQFRESLHVTTMSMDLSVHTDEASSVYVYTDDASDEDLSVCDLDCQSGYVFDSEVSDLSFSAADLLPGVGRRAFHPDSDGLAVAPCARATADVTVPAKVSVTENVEEEVVRGREREKNREREPRAADAGSALPRSRAREKPGRPRRPPSPSRQNRRVAPDGADTRVFADRSDHSSGDERAQSDPAIHFTESRSRSPSPKLMMDWNKCDAKGRCVRHPYVRLRKKKLFGRGWKKLLSACPSCALEELYRMHAAVDGAEPSTSKGVPRGDAGSDGSDVQADIYKLCKRKNFSAPDTSGAGLGGKFRPARAA